MKFKTYSGPIERPSRLAELGLQEEVLLEAVRRGQAAWASCTPNHPPSYRGISAWAETTSALRELLLPEGWTRSDNGNLPLTIDEAEHVSIAVSTGDEDTGRVDGSPCTRSSKGPRTATVVTINALQMKLFQEIRLCPDDLKEINGKMTWILLFHRDAKANEVRCELSRPVRMNVDGQVDGWAERIILGSTPFGGDKAQVPTDVPQSPNVVVDVKRRRA